MLAIGRQTRLALYRLAFFPRWLPVPDDLRFEVAERVSSTGKVLTTLNTAQLTRSCIRLRQPPLSRWLFACSSLLSTLRTRR